jgi:hypothetical protein
MSKIGCADCWAPEPTSAWDVIKNVPIEVRLIDEPHYIVLVRACPSCSQSYLQVTTERIDWVDGEDPVDRTIIPIGDAERDRLMAVQALGADTIEGIGAGRQSLRYDWPKGKEPALYWGTGVRVGIHD